MNKARSILLLLLLVPILTISSCSKFIEDKKKDLLIESITSSDWYIEEYVEGTLPLTEEFTGYYFKFDEDGTVSGRNGVDTEDGTWAGDLENYSVLTNFPKAGDPIKKLNGNWKVIDSGEDFVRAEMNTNTGKNILQLKKKI